jgi:hypothetical protein
MNSLVLRGVSVLRDGYVVGARLGDRYLAEPRMPEIQVSLRPSIQVRPEAEPEKRDTRVDQPSAGNSPACRTGRSACFAGVLSSRTPTRFVGRSISSGWSWARGGSSSTAAVTTAPVGKNFPTGLPVRIGHSPLAMKHRQGWAKPDGRTPPASSWGQGS